MKYEHFYLNNLKLIIIVCVIADIICLILAHCDHTISDAKNGGDTHS